LAVAAFRRNPPRSLGGVRESLQPPPPPAAKGAEGSRRASPATSAHTLAPTPVVAVAMAVVLAVNVAWARATAAGGRRGGRGRRGNGSGGRCRPQARRGAAGKRRGRSWWVTAASADAAASVAAAEEWRRLLRQPAMPWQWWRGVREAARVAVAGRVGGSHDRSAYACRRQRQLAATMSSAGEVAAVSRSSCGGGRLRRRSLGQERSRRSARPVRGQRSAATVAGAAVGRGSGQGGGGGSQRGRRPSTAAASGTGVAAADSSGSGGGGPHWRPAWRRSRRAQQRRLPTAARGREWRQKRQRPRPRAAGGPEGAGDGGGDDRSVRESADVCGSGRGSVGEAETVTVAPTTSVATAARGCGDGSCLGGPWSRRRPRL